MSLYDQFKTNPAKEAEGIEVLYGENKDKTVPKFILARSGKSNKAYQKMLEAKTRPYRRQMELGTMNEATAEKLFKDVFVSTVLKGWENVFDEAGNPLEFNKENAIKLLTDLPELYDDLQEKSKNASLFRDESLEEEAKN